MGNGLYLRKARTPDGKIVAEYLGDNGIWKRVPFGSEVEHDPDRFKQQMAQDGKKALVMTAVLALALIGPLVAGALWVIGSQPPAPSPVSVPPVVTAMSLSEYLWIIVPSAVLAVICWAMAYAGQDRYWGVK